MLKKIFTEHIRDTANPQTYREHFWVAFTNSIRLIWAGFQGIIHAFLPFVWPFKTSTQVIKSFKILVDTRRHHDELKEYLGNGYLHSKHMKKKK